jgi:hypothetical protein
MTAIHPEEHGRADACCCTLEGGRPNIRSPKAISNCAAPTHTRSEVRRKRGRGIVAAELEALRTVVITRLWEALRELMGSGVKYRC